MKELVEVIAKSLVENPDEVVVTETEKEDAIIVAGMNFESDPNCGKSSFFKKQQKSDCRYSAMKIRVRSCGTSHGS